MNPQEMRKDITRLIDDIKYHSDSLTPHHQLPIIQLNIILAKMNKMIEKTIILKHHLESNAEKTKNEHNATSEKLTDMNGGQQAKSADLDTAESSEIAAEANNKKDVAEKLKSSPIPDLKTAIGIYERYLFANELFNGNIEAYDEAIQALNDFEDLDKANYYINEGLVKEYNWDPENEFVHTFCSLVQRRYEDS